MGERAARSGSEKNADNCLFSSLLIIVGGGFCDREVNI